MLLQREVKESLNDFFQMINLQNKDFTAGKDKTAKIEQIVAYLEILHAKIRKYSKKRELVFIDSGAGNCYLSYLIYYFYSKIDKRPVQIHCLDHNQRLMEKNRELAKELKFDHMYFHGCDIMAYEHPGRPDVVYTLHACDTATDKALFLGCKTQARHILSVSCCQHTIKKKMKGGIFSCMTQHRIFKEKLLYMLGDSARALLLKMQGYEVDIIEFVSSRATGKNIMLRAHKGQTRNVEKIAAEYELLVKEFNVVPLLARYLDQYRNEQEILNQCSKIAC